jgi:hypothetical protein
LRLCQTLSLLFFLFDPHNGGHGQQFDKEFELQSRIFTFSSLLIGLRKRRHVPTVEVLSSSSASFCSI